MELISTEYTQNYISFKQELDSELNKAADGFVKIGYLLRQAEDTDVLRTSGYRNVTEFAAAEYGLTKDIVSRYININKRFSEGGYSDRLADRYHNYGLAKLAEMLTLPDNIVDAMPEDVSKEEIRDIKREYAEEQKISDIEVAIEKAEMEAQQKEEDGQDTNITYVTPKNPMENIIYDFLKTNPDEYLKFNDFMLIGSDIYNILAPSGSRVITSRIPGQGRYMLSITSPSEPVTVVSMREPDISYKYSLDELADYISHFIPDEEESHEIWYKKIFGEEWPEKEQEKEVDKEPENGLNTRKKLTSDNTQKKPEKRPEKRPEKKKQSKVTVIKPKVEVVPGVNVEIEDINKAESAASEEILRGEIEANPGYTHEEPEYEYQEMPESGLNTRKKSELEDSENDEVAPVQQISEEEPATERPYKDMPTEKLEEIFGEYYNSMDDDYQMSKRLLRQYCYEAAEQVMKKAYETFEKLIPYVKELNAREDEDNV